MKNKKGILLREMLSLIIAVICIGLLIYGSVRLYGIVAQKTEIEQARATLDQIFAEIEGLEEGEKGDYLVVNPKGWGLVGSGYSYQEKLPDECVDKNCLCICNKYSEYGIWKYDCDKQGVCETLNNKIIMDIIQVFGNPSPAMEKYKFIEREEPGNKDHKTIHINSVVAFDEVPLSLFFKKEGENIIISDTEMDKEITINFLNREVLFNNKSIIMSGLILNELTNDCSVNWDIKLGTGEIKVDEEIENFLKKESEDYLNELIEKEEIKGGKIIFTAAKQGWFKNAIIVSEGDTSDCYLLEEKQICSNIVDEHNDMRWYVRMYIC